MRQSVAMLRQQQTQAMAAKMAAALTSHAIPTQYAEVELMEHRCLAAFTGGYATPAHWDELAECRNVLMFGAGHRREEAKSNGEDWSQYQAIVELCYKVKTVMLDIRDREAKTGKMGINAEQLAILSGCIFTSADFWSHQPARLFRQCVQAVRALHPQAPKGNRSRK